MRRTRTSSDRTNRVAAAVVTAVVLLLSLGLGGCAPKRVLSTGAVRPAVEKRARPVVEAPPVQQQVRGRPDSTPGDFMDDMLGEPEPEYGPGLEGGIDPDFLLPEPEPLARSGEAVFDGGSEEDGGATGVQAVQLARAQLGKPYLWGAAGPDRFDCSGLVQYVYGNLGVVLPRVARNQAGEGIHVDREDLRPGDLVFFTLSGSRINHVGIYAGKGKFIHAPRRHNPVRMDSLNNSWWSRRFKGGRRLD